MGATATSRFNNSVGVGGLVAAATQVSPMCEVSIHVCFPAPFFAVPWAFFRIF